MTWKLSSASPTNGFFVRSLGSGASFRHRNLPRVSGSRHDVWGFTIIFWLNNIAKTLICINLVTLHFNSSSLTSHNLLSTFDSSPRPLSSCMMFRAASAAAADADGLMFPSGPGARRRRRRHLGWPKEGREGGRGKRGEQ